MSEHPSEECSWCSALDHMDACCWHWIDPSIESLGLECCFCGGFEDAE